MKAFPISAQSLEKHNGRDLSGMDLRDYFAAQAMTGAQIWDAVLNGTHPVFEGSDGPTKLAEVAYAVADAMMKARKQ